MKYYHVSMGIDETYKIFTPRIPNNGSGSEDRTIERICFSPTIPQCLSAIPNVIYDFERQWEENNEIYITVYTLDTNECDVYFMDNQEVQQYVPDAFLTGEVWCLEPITLEGQVIQIENYEHDFVYICSEDVRPQFTQEVIQYIDEGKLPYEALDLLNQTTVHDFVNNRLYVDLQDHCLVASDFKTAQDSGILYTFSINE